MQQASLSLSDNDDHKSTAIAQKELKLKKNGYLTSNVSGMII